MNTLSIPWWQNGVIYQIYPKSFQATGDKATGDIQGIIRRLTYLKNLGVSALWLTPIYPSPQIDNGYDVSDYCAINPDYGTLEDFDELVDKAHQLGLRIMMDMVFNHTSIEHPWFKAAEDKNSPYRNFYIWRDAKSNGDAPNNWRSKFGGSVWQWHPQSSQYYLHLFAPEQADLNWENAAVREELKKICQFWSDRGVDALRLDVINLISKPDDLRDDTVGDGRRFYTDGPKVHLFLKEMARDIFIPNQLKTVGEMSSTSLNQCQNYSNLDGTELTMTFNFHHLKVDYPQGEKWSIAEPNFIELKRLIKEWQTGMHNRAWNALFWCNHDQPRIVSRFGNENHYLIESAKMLGMVLHGLQGTPYLYQGEEIGMTNPNFDTIDCYRDIESLNIYQEKKSQGLPENVILNILACKSRDNGRTPMQWNESKNAGFTSGVPWIDTAKNYKHVNVKNALKDPNSVFYCYQKMIALRKNEPIFTLGNYQDLTPDHPSIWCYLRTDDTRQLLVMANLTDKEVNWDTPDAFAYQGRSQLLLANYPNSPKDVQGSILLRPYEACYFLRTLTESK